MRRGDVPPIFWTAYCWAGWIQSNMGSAKALGDLPRVEALMSRVLELEPEDQAARILSMHRGCSTKRRL